MKNRVNERGLKFKTNIVWKTNTWNAIMSNAYVWCAERFDVVVCRHLHHKTLEYLKDKIFFTSEQ